MWESVGRAVQEGLRQDWESVGRAVQEGLRKGIEEGAARSERDPAYGLVGRADEFAAKLEEVEPLVVEVLMEGVHYLIGEALEGAPVKADGREVGHVEDGKMVLTDPAMIQAMRGGMVTELSVGPVTEALGSTAVYYREPPEMP